MAAIPVAVASTWRVSNRRAKGAEFLQNTDFQRSTVESAFSRGAVGLVAFVAFPTNAVGFEVLSTCVVHELQLQTQWTRAAVARSPV
jgi:hypothetical protein